MVALITAEYWDDDTKKMEKSYVVKTDCESFREAAEYAELVYGSDLDTLKIELLDTTLYLNEEIFQAIREDRYL